MLNRLFLGKIDGSNIFLHKHEWSCGWYWSFGGVGNKRQYFNIKSLISGHTPPTDVNKVFQSTRITQEQWWIIRDLFIQADALQKAAQVYKLGGHQSGNTDETYIIINPEMAQQINADLEKVLNKVWDFVSKIVDKGDPI